MTHKSYKCNIILYIAFLTEILKSYMMIRKNRQEKESYWKITGREERELLEDNRQEKEGYWKITGRKKESCQKKTGGNDEKKGQSF